MLLNSLWWWVPATTYGTHPHHEMADTRSTHSPAVHTSKLCWSPCSTGWCIIHLRWYLHKRAMRHETRAKHKTLSAIILNHFWEKRGGLTEFLKEKIQRVGFPPNTTTLLPCALWHPSFEWSETSTSKHPGTWHDFNSVTNIKYSSWFPKDSLHQHFGN